MGDLFILWRIWTDQKNKIKSIGFNMVIETWFSSFWTILYRNKWSIIHETVQILNWQLKYSECHFYVVIFFTARCWCCYEFHAPKRERERRLSYVWLKHAYNLFSFVTYFRPRNSIRIAFRIPYLCNDDDDGTNEIHAFN